MEGSNTIPSVLSFALNQIQSVSVQAFQIQSSTGSGSVNPNGSIRFNLPQTSIMDFHTSKVAFSVTCTGNGARLPDYIENLFSGVRVTMGGVTVIQNNNLHGLLSTIQYETGEYEPDHVCGHTKCLDLQDAVGNDIQAKDAFESYGTGAGLHSRLFSINLGALRSFSPRLVDLSLLPAIQIELIVAPLSVMMAVNDSTKVRGVASSIVSANGSSPSFTVDRPVLNANCYSMLSAGYANSLRQRIADVGSLTFMYKQALAFQTSWNGSNRFSVAANSIDKISAVWRIKKNSTSGLGFVPVAGRCAGTIIADCGGDGTTGANAQNNTGERHYQATCNQMSIPLSTPTPDDPTGTRAAGLDASGVFLDYSTQADPLDFQFSINSAKYPQYQMGVGECYAMTCHANNVSTLPNCKSVQEYMGNKFIVAVPLNLPTYKYDKPAVTGLSTLGSNSFFEVQSIGTGNDATNFDSIVFVHTTSLLKVGSGKQLEIIL